jgi:hypothetical protein
MNILNLFSLNDICARCKYSGEEEHWQTFKVKPPAGVNLNLKPELRRELVSLTICRGRGENPFLETPEGWRYFMDALPTERNYLVQDELIGDGGQTKTTYTYPEAVKVLKLYGKPENPLLLRASHKCFFKPKGLWRPLYWIARKFG